MTINDIAPGRCGIMGILNVTPDSFYDGGKYNNTARAVKRAVKMKDEGADIIDIGGQSTRPGSKSVDSVTEGERVIPVIKELKSSVGGLLISCDTSRPEIAREALEAGADMINDVTGFKNKKMRVAVADYNVMAVIMHMQGTPETMQQKPVYGNLLKEVRGFLYERARFCVQDGVRKKNIIIDPGIGFGKKPEDNLNILANIKYYAENYPVMIGASRKSFLGALLELEVEERLAGSLAVAGYCATHRVKILRVHDVKETVEAVSVTEELTKRKS